MGLNLLYILARFGSKTLICIIDHHQLLKVVVKKKWNGFQWVLTKWVRLVFNVIVYHFLNCSWHWKLKLNIEISVTERLKWIFIIKNTMENKFGRLTFKDNWNRKWPIYKYSHLFGYKNFIACWYLKYLATEQEQWTIQQFYSEPGLLEVSGR